MWSHEPVPRTVQNPELPDENDLLYFVLVELNIENIAELKRVTKLELEGQLVPDQLKQFVEASCFFALLQRLLPVPKPSTVGSKRLVLL